MNELIFFSNNKNKIKEVKAIFKKENLKILTLNNFPKIQEPKENQNTFKKNATIKSNIGFKEFNTPCFADDSGICISALNNLPGVKSKRFIEENGGIEKTFELIFKETNNKNNYNAYFQTIISLTLNYKKVYWFRGVVNGKITKKSYGNNGFDYDKIFIPSGLSQTFAQISSNEKNKISHRFIALNKMKKFIKKLIN